MVQSGTLGDFHWVEIPWERHDIPSVVHHLARAIIGLTAVNVSWDSGRMIPGPEQEAAGWRRIGEVAVSPVVTAAVAAEWPVSHDGGKYDEWYFFRDLEGAPKLDAFCNWLSVSLEQAPDLAYPGGFDLRAQLERYRPEVVIGEGRNHLFVISLHLEIIEAVRALDEGHDGDEGHEGDGGHEGA